MAVQQPSRQAIGLARPFLGTVQTRFVCGIIGRSISTTSTRRLASENPTRSAKGFRSWQSWQNFGQLPTSKAWRALFTRKASTTAAVSATLLASTGGVLAFLAASTTTTTSNEQDDDHLDDKQHTAPIATPSHGTDHKTDSLPTFRLSEIRAHNATHPNPWVTSGAAVYDITDWVAAHPGGPIILRAAGGSIDPYWDIFTVHKTQSYVREILQNYLIGYVAAEDLGADGLPIREAGGGIDDPFRSDPVRDGRLRQLTSRPCNAESPKDELLESFLTPPELFYVRNHMWVPVAGEGREGGSVDGHAAADDHVLTVTLPSGKERSYTLRELRGDDGDGRQGQADKNKPRFRRATVTATLQCSGNRRSHMTKGAARETKGLQWDVGAIGNAEWEGVWLRDVLRDAGLQWDNEDDGTEKPAGSADAKDAEDTLSAQASRSHHVHMQGAESYGASIPLSTAVDPRADVLLAFKMNGRALPPDHGFPLRAIVPGHVAARSVKWLDRIAVAPEESPSQWQRRDYKCFGPNEAGRENWERARAIMEMPVTSAVTRVVVGRGNSKGKAAADAATNDGDVPMAVTGYAYSGGGREIVRVDVSLDGGRTWDQAKLIDDCDSTGSGAAKCKGHKAWAWKRWQYDGTFPRVTTDDGKACTTVAVKATDEAYNAQPESYKDIYNVRGNLATAWHRVQVCRDRGACGVSGKE